MEKLTLMIDIDITYIMDQLITNFMEDNRILNYTKDLCLVPPEKDKIEFSGAYTYTMNFANIKDVLQFGFDFGTCMKEHANLKKGGQ